MYYIFKKKEADAGKKAIICVGGGSMKRFGFLDKAEAYLKEVESAGSGIIIGKNDSELLIATNNHVIDGAETVSVSFVDNETYEATIKGTDSDKDLAVVAVPLSSISSDQDRSICQGKGRASEI